MMEYFWPHSVELRSVVLINVAVCFAALLASEPWWQDMMAIALGAAQARAWVLLER